MLQLGNSRAIKAGLKKTAVTVVWFDQIWSLEEYQQANARVHRQGQTNRIVVQRLVAEGTMDEDAAEAIEQKEAGQEALMQAVKARVGDGIY